MTLDRTAAPVVADRRPLSPSRINLVGTLQPLAAGPLQLTAPVGMTIAELVDLAVVGQGDEANRREWLIVSIGEHVIPFAAWGKVRPKPGTVVVFRATAGKDAARSLAFLAITIAALFIAPLVAPALVSALSISTAAATAVAGAAITIGGSLLVNALLPVRPPEIDSSPDGGRTSGRLLSIAGARNELRPYSPIPVVLGRTRIAPPYGARPFTEKNGNGQYLRCLFVAGYANLRLTDFRIGETSIDQFDEVAMHVREDGEGKIKKFPSQVYEEQLSITLLEEDSWHVRTTHDDADEISVDVVAPNGIFIYRPNKGEYDDRPVTVKAQYRRTGSSGSWTDMPDMVFTRIKKPSRRASRVELAEEARGQYDIRVRKATEEADSDKQVSETVVWTAIRSVTANPPIAFSGKLATVALRIEATNQLNGALDTLSCIAESRVTAFNGSTWVAAQLSRNPADLFRHVLQGPMNPRPVDTGLLDLDNLEDWWTFCAAKDLTCDLYVTERRSLWDILANVAACGRATPILRGGKWGVVLEQATDEVAWHFTPRNSSQFSASRVYRRIPHAFRVKFVNAERDFAVDERIVYRDGFDKSNATLFEAIEFPGVTSPTGVYKLARLQFAQAMLRPEFYTLVTDVEGLAVERGSRVRVSHDVPLWGTAAGRVTAVDGQLVTIDETVILEEGESYAMRFRLADGTGLLRTVVNTANETRSIELEGSGDMPEPGDLFSLGPIGRETAVLRVMGIQREDNLNARLTLCDDAPDMLTADEGDIPAYDPGITLPPDPFTLVPTGLVVAERIVGSGITAKAVVELSVQVPRVGRIRVFEFQMQDIDAGGGWEPFGTIAAPLLRATSDEAEIGTWRFRVRALFEEGTASNWLVSDDVDIVGLSTTPPDVGGFVVAVNGDLTKLSWNAVDAPNLAFYQLRHSKLTDGTATWFSALPVTRVSGAVNSTTVLTKPGTWMIKAVTFQDAESENAAAITTVTLGQTLLNVVENLIEDPAFAGTHENTVESLGALSLALDGDNFFPEGIYTFADGFDLGEVDTCRLSVDLVAAGSDIGDTMDKWTSLAEISALDQTDPSTWSVVAQYRTTDDDPGGSPTWSAWKTLEVGADATFRAVEFRLVLAGNPVFTGSVGLPGDPSTALQAATKQYVDGLLANLGKRSRVRAATTGNITISSALNNGDSIDGVTLATGDWVLVKNQSTSSQNGVYEVGASPARVGEFDTYNEHPGSLIAIADGTANADTLWLCTSNAGGTLGSTAIAFSKMVIAGELLAANNLSDIASAATAFANIKQAATDTTTGVVELATDTEVQTGTDTFRAVTPAGLRAATREKLTANRTYYVRTDGNDGNDGLSDSSGGAFLTIAKAISVVQALDRATYNVTIQVRSGTWTVPVVVSGWGPGSGTVTLTGDTTTPSNVTVSVTGVAFYFSGGKTTLRGFKVIASAYGVLTSGYAEVNINGAMEYGACTLAHLRLETFASVNITANYTISGAADDHWSLGSAHCSLVCRILTITLTGTPAFGAFCRVLFFGNATVDNITFSGSATGVRYSAQFNGLIYTAGGGATYLPGNSAGSVSTQGQYA